MGTGNNEAEIPHGKFAAAYAAGEAPTLPGANTLPNGSTNGMKEKNRDMENKKENKKHTCKIIVLKKELYPDLQARHLAGPKSGKCPYFRKGQEFIVNDDDFFRMLRGTFCSEAWDCISRYAYAALQGGSITRGWTNDEKIIITCCNDGTRPATFKLERIDG
jgi:uncharacterized repeat protein (TIGR04076 family)